MRVVLKAVVFGLFFFGSNAAAQERVLVFASSSLTTPLNAIADQYQRQTGQKITLSFASSSSLARQIVHRAPADIFISANTRWMEYAVEEGVIKEDTNTPWVSNDLVLISYNDGSELDLLPERYRLAMGAGRLAIGAPSHVPAGIYAKEALESLGLWEITQNQLAPANSARAALALVERGEAPYGVVYKTDARASGKVKVVAQFPPDSHRPIVYPAAITRESTSMAAIAFFDYLKSEEVIEYLVEEGFSKPLNIEDESA